MGGGGGAQWHRNGILVRASYLETIRKGRVDNLSVVSLISLLLIAYLMTNNTNNFLTRHNIHT